MKKPLIILSALVVGVLAFAVITAGNEPEKTPKNSQTSISESNTTTSEKEVIEAPSAGKLGVLEYSAAALAESDTKHNIIFFHAAWCTVCRSVQENLDSAAIPDDVSIFKVDYDSDLGKSLASQYSIPIQYTMVQVDTEGKEITQWVNNYGYGIDDIVGKIKT